MSHRPCAQRQPQRWLAGYVSVQMHTTLCVCRYIFTHRVLDSCLTLSAAGPAWGGVGEGEGDIQRSLSPALCLQATPKQVSPGPLSLPTPSEPCPQGRLPPASLAGCRCREPVEGPQWELSSTRKAHLLCPGTTQGWVFLPF